MTTLQRDLPLVGKHITFSFHDLDPIALDAYWQDIAQEAFRLQKVFNFYDPESELSRLNEDRSLHASKELHEVLLYAVRIWKETQGRFDVTWGRRFLARKQGSPEPAVHCTTRHLKHKGRQWTLDHKDALVDLGSLAKGYITDKLGAFLKRLGMADFLIDARGDLVAHGPAQEIDIQHPREASKQLGTIVVEKKGVATSGDYLQHQGDYSYSHLWGAQNAISSTVLAPTLMEADALATALCVLDKPGQAALMQQHPGAQALLVDKQLATTFLNGMQVRLQKEAPA